MKTNYLHIIPFLLITVCLCQCRTSNQGEISYIGSKNDKKNERIEKKNRKEREKINKLCFTDADFLKTKQRMSDEAIAPFDYKTGLIGDRAYNQKVYITALGRIKKRLSVRDNQFVLNINSGKEVNMSEDLYEYIIGVIQQWNEWIKKGSFKIISTENGYDIEPVKK